MAYVGNCTRHGQYLNSCSGCEREAPLQELVKLVKSGCPVDKALEKVLKDVDNAELRKNQAANDKRLHDLQQGLARADAIRRLEDEGSIPRVDGPTFGSKA